MKPFPEWTLTPLPSSFHPQGDQVQLPAHPFWQEPGASLATGAAAPRPAKALATFRQELKSLSRLAANGNTDLEGRISELQQRLETVESLFQALANHVLSDREALQELGPQILGVEEALRAIESRFSIVATATGSTAKQLEQSNKSFAMELSEIQLQQDLAHKHLQALEHALLEQSRQVADAKEAAQSDLQVVEVAVSELTQARQRDQQDACERLASFQAYTRNELDAMAAQGAKRVEVLDRHLDELQAGLLDAVGIFEKQSRDHSSRFGELSGAQAQHTERLTALHALQQEQLETLAARDDSRHVLLEGRLEALAQEANELLASHATHAMRIEGAMEDIGHVRLLGQDAQGGLERLTERLNALTRGADAQANEIADLDARSSSNLSQNEDLKAELNRLAADFGCHQAEFQHLQDQATGFQDQLREKLAAQKAENVAQQQQLREEGDALKSQVTEAILELTVARQEIRAIETTLEPLIEAAVQRALAARQEEIDQYLAKAVEKAVPKLESKAIRGLMHLQGQLSQAVTEIGHLRRTQQLAGQELTTLREALAEIEGDLQQLDETTDDVTTLRHEHARLATRIHSIVGMLSRHRPASA